MPHTFFPHVGSILASIGSQNFARAFHELINTQLKVDAVHLHVPARRRPSEPSPISLVFDETAPSPSDVTGFTDSVHLHPTNEPDDYACSITVFRSASSPCFCAHERRRLQDLSPFLFSILEKHGDTLQTVSLGSETSKAESLEERFHERLRETGLKLSERETQVCLGLLAGHTALEQAERLTLKVNTIGSYQRRVAVKLGISGRHSLMRWLYASPRSIPMTH